jgi:hypothetical protein
VFVCDFLVFFFFEFLADCVVVVLDCVLSLGIGFFSGVCPTALKARTAQRAKPLNMLAIFFIGFSFL